MGVKCFLLEEIKDPGGRRWRRTDTGEVFLQLGDAPVGAIWDAYWMRDAGFSRTGPDGKYLVCRLPDGSDWCIDSRASNCTLPDDDAHRCWARHGEAPHLTVDKDGLTCHAGAGSIQVRTWHGFLRNGELVE